MDIGGVRKVMIFLENPIPANKYRTVRLLYSATALPSEPFFWVIGTKDDQIIKEKKQISGYSSANYFAVDVIIDMDFIFGFSIFSPNKGTNYGLNGGYSVILGNGTTNNFIGEMVIKSNFLSDFSGTDDINITDFVTCNNIISANLPSSAIGTTGRRLDLASNIGCLVTGAYLQVTTGAGTTTLNLALQETATATSAMYAGGSFQVTPSTTYYVRATTTTPTNIIVHNLISVAMAEPINAKGLNVGFQIINPLSGDSASNGAFYGILNNNRNFVSYGTGS